MITNHRILSIYKYTANLSSSSATDLNISIMYRNMKRQGGSPQSVKNKIFPVTTTIDDENEYRNIHSVYIRILRYLQNPFL